LVAPCRRAMQQADVVQRITTAGLVIDAAIVPHDEIAQAPFMTIHVPWRRLVSEQRIEQRLRLGIVHALYADGKARRAIKTLATRYRMGAHYRMKQILHGASFIIFLATSGVTGPTWSTRSFP
jgi:hypothetical protein